MATSPPLLLLALLLSPALGFAQTVHQIADPEPNTVRCQNEQAARHVDGDVVAVEYFGQWRREPGRRVSQNAGPGGVGCATERIVRLSQDGRLRWELRAGDVFSAADSVADIAALADGRTLLSINHEESRTRQRTTITMLSPAGDVEWTYQTQVAPRFSLATIHTDEQRIYLSFQFTDYAYAERGLQVRGGKMWPVKKNQLRTLVVALDGDGAFLWEVPDHSIISATGGEVATIRFQTRRTDRSRTRYQLGRLSQTGEVLSTAWTPWHTSEGMVSAIRHGDTVWMTTLVEHLDAQAQRVLHRTGQLRVYTFEGKQLHSRPLSDSAILAANDGTQQVQIVSPVECRRGIDAGVCVSSAFDVLTLKSWRDTGLWSRLDLGTSSFEIGEFEAASTPTGLFVSAKTYARTRAHEAAPGVSLVHTAGGDDVSKTTPPLFVWRPLPRRPAPEVRQSF